MRVEAAPRRDHAARRLDTEALALRGKAQMPRPRCSYAAVAETRVRCRRWSVVGGGGARASRRKEQGRCHLGPPPQRGESHLPTVAVALRKLPSRRGFL